MDHSLSYFKTCNSDDSACEAKGSCGKPHRSAKKKAPDHSETFIRVCRRGLRAEKKKVFLKGRLSNASNCADAALARCDKIDDIVFTLTSTSPSQIFLFLYLLNHASMPLLRILVITDSHQQNLAGVVLQAFHILLFLDLINRRFC